MEFNGEHECKLDAKGRLLLPFRLKNKLPEDTRELKLSKGMDPCLVLYTPSTWRAFTQRFVNIDQLDDVGRKLYRTTYAANQDVELDSAGRIQIPKIMLPWAGLTHEVIALGLGDHIEFWNAELYQQYIYGDPASFSAAAKAYALQHPHAPNFFLHSN
jgi:MraZ protein